MRYKVIQWATGYTGMYALRYVLDNPKLQLVGLKCFSEAKEGIDAGPLCGREPVGVKATRDIDAILKLDADCVIYMPGDPGLADPTIPGSHTHELYMTVLRILESGKNVVSTFCPLIYTQHLGPSGKACVDALEAACKKGGTSVFFTGFEPGFMGDVLPLTLASTCGSVKSITASEILDCSVYDRFDTLQAMGFGRRPEELPATGLEVIRSTWGGVPYIAAKGLGIEIDDIKVGAEVFLSPITFPVTNGIIEAGTIAALRFTVDGLVDGEPRIRLEHIDRMREDMAPDWLSLPPKGGYRVVIEGSNPVRADFHLGLPGGTGSAFGDAMAMTAGRAVNSVEAIVQASPGYKTFLDLPPLTGKYTMRRLVNSH